MAPGAESRTISGWKLDALGHVPTRGYAGSRYREYLQDSLLEDTTEHAERGYNFTSSEEAKYSIKCLIL